MYDHFRGKYSEWSEFSYNSHKNWFEIHRNAVFSKILVLRKNLGKKLKICTGIKKQFAVGRPSCALVRGQDHGRAHEAAHHAGAARGAERGGPVVAAAGGDLGENRSEQQALQ